jgi:hypothetical protein
MKKKSPLKKLSGKTPPIPGHNEKRAIFGVESLLPHFFTQVMLFLGVGHCTI